MNQYDLNLILNPNLSAEQVSIEKDYIETTVKNAGSEITASTSSATAASPTP